MTYIQFAKRLLEVANDVLDYGDVNYKLNSEMPDASSFFINVLDILSDGDASCLRD